MPIQCQFNQCKGYLTSFEMKILRYETTQMSLFSQLWFALFKSSQFFVAFQIEADYRYIHDVMPNLELSLQFPSTAFLWNKLPFGKVGFPRPCASRVEVFLTTDMNDFLNSSLDTFW